MFRLSGALDIDRHRDRLDRRKSGRRIRRFGAHVPRDQQKAGREDPRETIAHAVRAPRSCAPAAPPGLPGRSRLLRRCPRASILPARPPGRPIRSCAALPPPRSASPRAPRPDGHAARSWSARPARGRRDGVSEHGTVTSATAPGLTSRESRHLRATRGWAPPPSPSRARARVRLNASWRRTSFGGRQLQEPRVWSVSLEPLSAPAAGRSTTAGSDGPRRPGSTGWRISPGRSERVRNRDHPS